MPKFPTRNLLAEAKRISKHIINNGHKLNKKCNDDADKIRGSFIYDMRDKKYKNKRRLYYRNRRIV